VSCCCRRGGLCALAWHWYRTPLAAADCTVGLRGARGATLSSVAHQLAMRRAAVSVRLDRARARQRADRSIKAGSYEIGRGRHAAQLLAKLTQGDVTQTSLTIVEGTTFADLRARCATIRRSRRADRPAGSRAPRARSAQRPQPGGPVLSRHVLLRRRQQ
jgi:cell division protein YceG involved in septum cleavage